MGMYGWHDNELEAYNVIVENDLTVKGTISFGDEVADKLIIQGRVSSMTAAGAAMQITSAYAYGEGIEMRYQVTNWTGVGSSFKGMYLRAEAITGSAAAKSVYGAEIYGVCNNVTMTTGSLWGALFYAYVKGVAAVTVNNMYAVQGELTWDASRTGDCTITTAAACFRAKITGGRVADYTKIHGYELTIGEMDGDSAKFGSGIFMQDDSGMSGTCTLTTGIDIAIGCTTGISIGGTCSTAGILLGTTNKLSFHDSDIYMRASADGHFEIVSDDTITLSVPGSGHGGIVFGGETDWGTGATGPDLDGTGWDWVTQTVGRVDTENVTAAAYAGQYTALTVTKGQNLTSSFFANWNELYISASSVMTGASNFASIWAQVELGATVTSTDAADFMAAVYGNFKTGATFTNNTKVCGFLAQSEVATSGLTNNGTISAFYAMKKSGCQVWDHGLYIADAAATTGIQIGNATTGISISGATTDALSISGDATTAINITSGCSPTDGLKIAGACANAINITGVATTKGIVMTSQTAGLFQGTTTMTLSSAHRNALEINAISPANAAYELRGLYVTAYPSTAEQATSKMRGVYSEVKSTLNIDNMVAVYGYANMSAAKTIATGSAALHGDVNVDNATTLSAGRMAALWAQVRGDSALTGNLDCVYVDAEMDVDNAIYVNVDTAKTATAGLSLAGAGAYTTGISVIATTTEAIDITGNATRAINIDTGAFTSGLTMSAAFSGNALSLTNSALTAGDSYSGVRVAVTAAAASNAYGMSGYFDATITGTTAGHCYGLGSWINTSTTPVLSAGHIIVPLECGVYTGEAQASARIVLGQFQAVLNGAPASLHIFRANTSHTITAIFDTGNHGSIGYAGSALETSTKCGDIPIADVSSQGVVYVRCYDAAG